MGLRAIAVRACALALAAAAIAWIAPHFGAVYVRGASMGPTLAPGDFVVYRRGSAGLREGDVVLVTKPGWPAGVLHRVIAVGLDRGLTLRGDANPVADRDPASPASVRGIVVVVVPSGRTVAAVWRLARGWYNRAPHHA